VLLLIWCPHRGWHFEKSARISNLDRRKAHGAGRVREYVSHHPNDIQIFLCLFAEKTDSITHADFCGEVTERGCFLFKQHCAVFFSDSQFALNRNPQGVLKIRCQQDRGTSIISVTASTDAHATKACKNVLKIVCSF